MDQTTEQTKHPEKNLSGNNKTAFPWSLSVDENFRELQVDPEQGLSRQEVKKRLNQYGPNQLKEYKKKNTWQIFVEQIKSLIILLLIIAAVVSFWYNEILEGWAIVTVILLNTGIGFFTELRAVRSMEALFKLGTVKTRVRRDGEVKEIDAGDMVPGDIVVVEGGDIITADLRIIKASKLQVDESALTGESLPSANPRNLWMQRLFLPNANVCYIKVQP